MRFCQCQMGCFKRKTMEEPDGEEEKKEEAAKTSMDASAPPVSEDIPVHKGSKEMEMYKVSVAS